MKDCQINHEWTGYNYSDADGIERFFRSPNEGGPAVRIQQSFAETKEVIEWYIHSSKADQPHFALGHCSTVEFRNW